MTAAGPGPQGPHDWRRTAATAGKTPRHLLDEDGVTWEVWYQGPTSPEFDLVRFYGPEGQLRMGGIPTGTWAEVSEENLFSALEHSFKGKQQ